MIVIDDIRRLEQPWPRFQGGTNLPLLPCFLAYPSKQRDCPDSSCDGTPFFSHQEIQFNKVQDLKKQHDAKCS